MAAARAPAGTQEKAGVGQSNRNCDTLDRRHQVPTLGSPALPQDFWPTPGPRTPPAYGEDTATIPPIRLPTLGGDSGVRGLASGMALPITKRDNRLLDGLLPGLPMEVGISRAPGSG